MKDSYNTKESFAFELQFEFGSIEFYKDRNRNPVPPDKIMVGKSIQSTGTEMSFSAFKKYIMFD